MGVISCTKCVATPALSRPFGETVLKVIAKSAGQSLAPKTKKPWLRPGRQSRSDARHHCPSPA